MHKILSRIGQISARTFLYLLIASSLVCVISLRQNNQTMVKLRDALYTADKNNADINGALNSLRRYVYAHMNTNLSSGNNNIKPPIQLKYTYQRLLDNEQGSIEAKNQQVYTDAQNYCQSINKAYFGTTRVPCVQNYVVNHGVNTTVAPIPAGLYEFDFVSPTWSPDLAGWSLLISIVLLAAFLVRVGVNRLAA